MRGIFAKIVLTETKTNRAFSAHKLKNIFAAEGINCSVERDIQNALLTSLENASNENAILLITGSFYLAADIMKSLNRM